MDTLKTAGDSDMDALAEALWRNRPIDALSARRDGLAVMLGRLCDMVEFLCREEGSELPEVTLYVAIDEKIRAKVYSFIDEEGDLCVVGYDTEHVGG